MVKEFLKSLDESDSERLRVKLTIVKGKLSDIVFQYESFIDGKWISIVRYDMAHNFFHRDVLKPNGEKEKTAIDITGLTEAQVKINIYRGRIALKNQIGKIESVL
jgi:hypothetical protein